jgi:hypothetical protein
MPNTIHGPASAVDQLGERVEDLERRLSALEHKLEISTSVSAPSPVASPQAHIEVSQSENVTADSLLSAAVILGKAILGIAGAYLLRALAESALVPRPIVLTVALLYACFWMVLAARAHPMNRLAVAVYGIAASLILASMVWESTLHFHILSSPFASSILVSFFVLTLAVSHPRRLQILPAIASLVVSFTALALVIETRELLPFAIAVLAITLVTELFVSAGYPISSRAIPAFSADLAIWLLVSRLTSPGLAEQYPGVPPLAAGAMCLVLFAIFATGIAYRSFLSGMRITIFEILQSATTVALLAAAATGLGRWAEVSAAVLFVLLSVANYWAAISRFSTEDQRRNRIMSEVFAPALFTSAVFLLLPPTLESLVLSFASVVAIVAYARSGRLVLAIHADIYIAIAAILSSLPGYIANAFGGSIPAAPDASFSIVAVSALVCYLVGSRRLADRGTWRVLDALPALLVSVSGASLVVAGMVRISAGRLQLDASRISVIRTAAICLAALALGFFAAHWKRAELVWVAYSVVALGTLKLFLEDLRFGNPTTLMISLLFYGLVLVFLPKLARQASQAS